MAQIIDMDAWTTWVQDTISRDSNRITQLEFDAGNVNGGGDLQHRVDVLEARLLQLTTSYTHLLDFLSGRTINRADMTSILGPISVPGELPSISGADQALLGLESSELLVSPRPGGASKSIIYGGGSVPSEPATDTGAPRDGSASEPDLTHVVWLGTNVASWSETVTLTATIDPVNLRLSFTDNWTAQRIGSRSVEGTAWIFVYQNGTYYAAPFSDVLAGQRTWSRTDVNGVLVDLPPVISTWVPTPGVRYWFMVSGIARTQVRNSSERSSLVPIVW